MLYYVFIMFYYVLLCFIMLYYVLLCCIMVTDRIMEKN